jgi:hypothetical protein
MTADQIYQNFHTQAKGTAGLESAQQIAQELADWYPDSAVSVQKLVDGIRSGWQGDAAEAASQGLTPLAENSLTTGQQLGTAQDLISRQVGSFHTAAAEVQQVPPEPSMVDAIGSALLGQPPVGALVQMEQHHAVQQANVDAYQKYVSASQYNTSNLPPLADSVASPTAPVSVTLPTADTASTATGSTSAPRLPSSTARTSSASTRSTATTGTSKLGQPAVPSGRSPVSTAPTPPTGSGIGTVPTTVSSAAPPVTTPSPGHTPPTGTGSGSIPGSSQPAWPTEEPIGFGGGAVPPFGGGAENEGRTAALRSGGFGGDEGVAGGSGFRSGIGTGGRSTPLAGQAPGTRSGIGGDSEGARSGAAPATAEEEALAAERNATTPGSTSTAAGPMAGGRGGRGGGDGEHKRKYVLDEDGEATFGISDMVAPPVIGED